MMILLLRIFAGIGLACALAVLLAVAAWLTCLPERPRYYCDTCAHISRFSRLAQCRHLRKHLEVQE